LNEPIKNPNGRLANNAISGSLANMFQIMKLPLSLFNKSIRPGKWLFN